MRSLFLLLLLCTWFGIYAQTNPAFPLRVSKNGKYLIDRKQKPFLVKEISAWGLIQALSEADEAAFIDSVKKKGFNTLMVSIISYDTRFAGSPPDWQGISPFSVKWDLSTYNTAYFAHADRFLRLAKSKGMLVLLVPCYLGYKGDANQGWWGKLLDPHNSPAKSRTYGEFLGKRYRNFTNIIWEAGGDNRGAGQLYPYMNNIIKGIKEFDKGHLWTGHFESAYPTNWSSGDTLYTKYINIDGLYDFEEKNLGPDTPQYKTELEHYGKGRMILQLDQSYEQDIPHGADNTNYQIIRRKNYDGLLSGCAGTSFSPGRPDNQCYTLTNWRPLMNTRGMQEAKYCFRLFASRAWYKLTPDTGNAVIRSDRGRYGSADYVCAAKTTDGNTYIAYLPRGGNISLNPAALKFKEVRAWWYDPRTGKSKTAGLFAGNKIIPLSTPTGEDWLLVLDNAALKLPMPGR